MTSNASAKRRIAIASSALAAFALLAGHGHLHRHRERRRADHHDGRQEQGRADHGPAAKRKTSTNVKAAATVASPTDFTSIFAGQLPAYTNSGWATCPAAITWNVDTTGLTEAQATRQLANLEFAFAQWTAASGLTFQFAGSHGPGRQREPVRASRPPSGSASPSRHINLAFLDDASSSLLGGNTVGMAGPSTVWADSKEIEGGAGIFLTRGRQADVRHPGPRPLHPRARPRARPGPRE